MFKIAGIRFPRNLGVGPFFPAMTPAPAVRLLISGITKNSSGAALPSCVVKLFRTADDVLMEQSVSGGDGAYSFSAVGSGQDYYIVAYKDDTTDLAGTTVNTLTGV